MTERIETIQYNPLTYFDSNPTEFLVAAVAAGIAAVPEFKELFGTSIYAYMRMDLSERELPALRVYNLNYTKEFESWFIEGDVIIDAIFPASIRRDMLQQLQDTVSTALLQQFRRPKFFDAMGEKVPGLNELGKTFSVDKALGFKWGDDEVPLTQITLNFKLDLRIWDDYLEQTNRTKDSPFEEAIGDLKRILAKIQGLNNDETVNVTLNVDQKV